MELWCGFDANAGDARDAGSIPGLRRSHGEGKGYPLQYSGLENSMDCIVHGVSFTFHFHALEKEMATHSSVLAWRIPETGDPGGLPSIGLPWGLNRLISFIVQ